MRSKTLFFNRTLFRKTVSRFWPIWFFYFGVWFIAVPLVLMTGLRWSNNILYLQRDILDVGAMGGVAITGIFAVLSAMAVWSFLYNSRSMSGTACLPVRREGVFVSVTLAGLLPLLAVHAVIVLLCVGVQLVYGQSSMRYLIEWFGIVSLQVVFFYGFAVFCAQLTGNVLVLPAVYAVLNFTAYVVESLVRSICAQFVYGGGRLGDKAVLNFLSPPVELLSKTWVQRESVYDLLTNSNVVLSYRLCGWGVLAAYAAAGLAFAVLALLLYRRRRMESTGDVVAVNMLKPVFKYCMTFGCALVLGMVLYAVTDWRGDEGMGSMLRILLWMLVGAVIGYFTAEMLICKSFRVWKGKWAGLAAAMAIITVLMFAVELDAFGYERRVPAAEDVASVEVYGAEMVELTEPENIDAVLALHRSVIENKAWHESYYRQQTKEAAVAETRWMPYDTDLEAENAEKQQWLKIVYRLKNGTSMERNYFLHYVQGDESACGDVRKMETLLNSREAIAFREDLETEPDARNIMNARVSSTVLAAGAELAALNCDTIECYDPEDGRYLQKSELLPDKIYMGECGWELSAEEALELYRSCIMPELDSGALGRVWLILDAQYQNAVTQTMFQFDVLDNRGGVGENRKYVSEQFYIGVTEDASRTCTWLENRGIPCQTIAETNMMQRAYWK